MITPGPWKARYVSGRYAVETWCIDWSENQEEVAEIVHGEANARLIAEAPAMIEALKAIVWDNYGQPAIWPEEIIVKAIIARAEGKE